MLPIMEAMSLAQVIASAQLITQARSTGINSMDELAATLDSYIKKRHSILQRVESKKGRNISNNCPDHTCNGETRIYPRKDIDGELVLIEKCDTCQLSFIVEARD